jgi:hypothetical protein
MAPKAFPYAVLYKGEVLGFFRDRDDAVDVSFYFEFQEKLDNSIIQGFVDHIIHFCAVSKRQTSLAKERMWPTDLLRPEK